MATVNSILYTSKKYKDGTYPIMIRVHHRGQKKYFKVGGSEYNVQASQWDKTTKLLKTDKRVNLNYKEQNLYILEQQNRLEEIIKGFDKQGIAWTFNQLEIKYKDNPNYTSFLECAERRIAKLRERDRVSTRRNYESMLKALRKIFGDKRIDKLEVADIDYDFVEKIVIYGEEKIYKNDAMESRWSGATLKLYLSHIKAILRSAIVDGNGSPTTYPFGEDYGATKYCIVSRFKTIKKKKSINKVLMDKFIAYEPYRYHQMYWIKHYIFLKLLVEQINEKSTQIWLLKGERNQRRSKRPIKRPELKWKGSVQLKPSDLITKEINSKLEVVLVLTKEKHKINEEIILTDQMKAILDWFKTHSEPMGDYLFPILTEEKPKDFDRYCYQKRNRQLTFIWETKEKYKLPPVTKETFEQWNNLKFYEKHLIFTKKLFLFSYYAQGINMSDMAVLTKKDCITSYDEKNGEYQHFTFRRNKGNKKSKEIEVHIGKHLQELLDWFNENYPPKGNYLLPMITDLSLTGEELYDHVRNVGQNSNRNLRTLAKLCGLPEDLQRPTNYYARHSYATRMRNIGAPIDVISEALGHSDTIITQTYLESFGHKNINAYNELL